MNQAAAHDVPASRPQPIAGVASVDVDPFGNGFLSDPYAQHEHLREAGAVIWLERYGIYAAARHAEVSAALADWQTFSSARGVGLSDFAKEEPWRLPSLLLETDPPLHDRMRKIMGNIFSLPRVRGLGDAWRREADVLVAPLVESGRFDAVLDLAEVFPLRIFPKLVGLGPEAPNHLLQYAGMAFNAFGPRNALFHEAADRARDAIEWVDDACRRENLSEDGWGMDVYRAADDGQCTEEEAHRLVRSLLSAGVDTTINGIGNMLHAFSRNPAQWDALRERPELRKKAFEESLRWDSTVQTFFRTVSRPTEFGGVLLPADSKILLFLAAANRDPRRWDEPERFDIHRQVSGHVGFGFGVHQCLGQMIARLEAEAVLEALIPRVSAFHLDGEPVRRLNNTLHALMSLRLKVDTA